MAKRPVRGHQMGRFPRLRQLRVGLGWEVTDLASRLPQGPKISSIYNLEDGKAIRLVSVRRVFDAVNRAHNGELAYEKEVIEVQN